MDGYEDLATIELRSMRAAWKALAARWDLTFREREELLPAGGEGDEFPPGDTETRMRILIEIGYRVGSSNGDLTDWLRAGAPVLGFLSPLEAMSGSLAELRGFRRLVEAGFAS